MDLSWNGCNWESSPRTPRSVWAEKVGAATPTRPHTRARAQKGPHAVALDPSGRAVIGNTSTLIVALAAGLGGAFVCLLVVSIVWIVRRRRPARAADPGSDVRTLLYVD
jgi:hypothetical protein